MPDIKKLLADVKGYIGVTWQDDVTDSNITGYINRGMARLQKIAGAPLDFDEEDQPRMLLLDYCRYANSQALEVFEKNFQSELLALNLFYQATTVWILKVTSEAGAEQGKTKITVLPGLTAGNSYMYKTGSKIALPVLYDYCSTAEGFVPWDGTAEIPTAVGDSIVIVEVDENRNAIKAGMVQRTG